MSYLPDGVLRVIARRWCAGDYPGLSVPTLRAVADLHESRGEHLSAAQYRDMADDKEEVEDGG